MGIDDMSLAALEVKQTRNIEYYKIEFVQSVLHPEEEILQLTQLGLFVESSKLVDKSPIKKSRVKVYKDSSGQYTN